MMQLVLDSAYSVTSAQCDRPLQPRLVHHYTQVNTRKRAALLCKQGRPIAALSLLYGRVTAHSRVKQFQLWSDARVRIDPMAASAAANPEQFCADIRKLHKDVTSDIAKEARDDVFHMVVQRYCRRAAALPQLAHLRRALGSQCESQAAPIWNAVASALDDELARRALVKPLKEICAQLLQPANDAYGLDRAFMRLAVALQRVDDQGAGNRSLVRALHYLTDTEARTLARQLFEGAAHGGVSGAARLVNALASAPAFGPRGQLVNQRDVAGRRAALAGVLQGALREHLEGRLDYFVRSTAQLIRNRIDRGDSAQNAYQAGSASLEKVLASLRYADIADEFAPRHLVPRLMPRVLAAKEAAVTAEFLGALDDATFAHVQGELSAGGVQDAWPALRAARDHKLSRHRDILNKAMYELQSRAAAGDRGAAAVQVVKVAESLAALRGRMETLGMDLGADERQKIEHRLEAACRVFRHADNPQGALGGESIAALSEDEVRHLRIASRYLAPFGLSLGDSALEREAWSRSARHRDEGIRALQAFVSAAARSPADIDSAVHALRDAVEVGTAALQTLFAFMDIGAEEIVKMADDWARHAVPRAAQLAAPAAARSTCETLRHALADVFEALTDISSQADDPDAPDMLPVRAISEMMVLARYLMVSTAAELGQSATDGQTGPAGQASAAPAWTPALRSLIAGEFGVDYDPQAGAAHLLLAPDQYKHLIAGLAEPIVLDPAKTKPMDTPVGEIRASKQFLRDIKGSVKLSASGVSADGRYVPHTAPIRGEADPAVALAPVLGALHRLAGARADTAAHDTEMAHEFKVIASILEYATQTALAEWCKTTVHFGPDGPYKLPGGRAVFVGGGGDIDVHVTRCADGRYLLRMAARVSPSANIVVYRPDGEMEGIQVDPARTFYAITYGLALSFDKSGGHTVEVVLPPTLRYRVAEFAPAEDAASRRVASGA